MGKSENYFFFLFFFGNYCSLGSQSCFKHLANEFMKLSEHQKVKVIL